MTKVQDLLERRSDGWEADEEDAGEGLYYTEKQTRVFKAIVKNRDASLKEVADTAGVHPSYVRYIVNRLPADKATDLDWLMDKAGINSEEIEEEDVGEPPALSEEEANARGEEEKTEEEAVMQSFGVGSSPEEVEEEMTGDGYQVSMTRMLPVTITVNIPEDALETEMTQAAEEATERLTQQVNSD